MNDTSKNPPDFGHYAPKGSGFWLWQLNKFGFCRGSVQKWVAKKWKQKSQAIVDVRLRGINYRLHADKNGTDYSIIRSSKVHDRKELKCIAEALTLPGVSASDSVLVDIGANTGYHSLNAAQMGYSKIIAIEPNPPVTDALIFNIEINNLSDKIDVLPICIGNGEPIPFFVHEDWSGSSTVLKWKYTDPIDMPSKPLLDLLQERNIKQITAIKIDIEGDEDRALYPFFNTAPEELLPKVVLIEDYFRGLWKNDVITTMKEKGYVEHVKTSMNLILHRR